MDHGFMVVWEIPEAQTADTEEELLGGTATTGKGSGIAAGCGADLTIAVS